MGWRARVGGQDGIPQVRLQAPVPKQDHDQIRWPLAVRARSCRTSGGEETEYRSAYGAGLSGCLKAVPKLQEELRLRGHAVVSHDMTPRSAAGSSTLADRGVKFAVRGAGEQIRT